MPNESVYTECLNSITSAHEVYTWMTNPPTTYVGYITITTNDLYSARGDFTTWTGEKLGTCRIGREYDSGPSSMRSIRRSIDVMGTNGKTYHGTYFVSSGDYARITMNTRQK